MLRGRRRKAAWAPVKVRLFLLGLPCRLPSYPFLQADWQGQVSLLSLLSFSQPTQAKLQWPKKEATSPTSSHNLPLLPLFSHRHTYHPTSPTKRNKKQQTASYPSNHITTRHQPDTTTKHTTSTPTPSNQTNQTNLTPATPTPAKTKKSPKCKPAPLPKPPTANQSTPAPAAAKNQASPLPGPTLSRTHPRPKSDPASPSTQPRSTLSSPTCPRRLC